MRVVCGLVGMLFLGLAAIGAVVEPEASGTIVFLIVAFLFLLPALFAGPAHPRVSDAELRQKARRAFAGARILGAAATAGLAWLAIGPGLGLPIAGEPKSLAAIFSALFGVAWLIRFFGAYYSAQSEPVERGG